MLTKRARNRVFSAWRRTRAYTVRQRRRLSVSSSIGLSLDAWRLMRSNSWALAPPLPISSVDRNRATTKSRFRPRRMPTSQPNEPSSFRGCVSLSLLARLETRAPVARVQTCLDFSLSVRHVRNEPTAKTRVTANFLPSCSESSSVRR